MALQLGALRDALIDAGATQAKAEKAAEELAGYENRLAGMDTRLTVLTWMVGTNIVLTLGVSGACWRTGRAGRLTLAAAPTTVRTAAAPDRFTTVRGRQKTAPVSCEPAGRRHPPMDYRLMPRVRIRSGCGSGWGAWAASAWKTAAVSGQGRGEIPGAVKLWLRNGPFVDCPPHRSPVGFAGRCAAAQRSPSGHLCPLRVVGCH